MGENCRRPVSFRGAEVAASSCPVCGDALSSDVVTCPDCETPHHGACWNFVGRCAMYGCGAAPRAATALSATPSRPNAASALPMPERTAKPVKEELVRVSPPESEPATQTVFVNNFIVDYSSSESPHRSVSYRLYGWALLFMVSGIAAFWVDWRAAVVLLLISAGLNSLSGVEKPRDD